MAQAEKDPQSKAGTRRGSEAKSDEPPPPFVMQLPPQKPMTPEERDAWERSAKTRMPTLDSSPQPAPVQPAGSQPGPAPSTIEGSPPTLAVPQNR